MSEEPSDLYECPRCGPVRVLDRDLILIEKLIPGSDQVESWDDRGLGFRCPSCGVAWWKDLYDMRDHWRREPTGLRPN